MSTISHNPWKMIAATLNRLEVLAVIEERLTELGLAIDQMEQSDELYISMPLSRRRNQLRPIYTRKYYWLNHWLNENRRWYAILTGDSYRAIKFARWEIKRG